MNMEKRIIQSLSGDTQKYMLELDAETTVMYKSIRKSCPNWSAAKLFRDSIKEEYQRLLSEGKVKP